MQMQKADLDGLQFAFLCCKLLLPLCLGVCVCLEARFELVDLLPAVVELATHIVDLFRELGLDIFAPLVKVKLDLR